MYSTIRFRERERRIAQGAKVVVWLTLLMIAHGAYILFTLGIERIYG